VRVLFLSLFLTLIGALDTVRAQESTPSGQAMLAIGIHAGFVRSWHTMDFLSPDGIVPLCCSFPYGRSDGYVTGIVFTANLAAHWNAEADLKIGAASMTLIDQHSFMAPYRNGSSVEIRTFISERTIDFKMHSSLLDLTCGYEVIAGLRLCAGFEFALISGTGENAKERVYSPEGLSLDDSSRFLYIGRIEVRRRPSIGMVGALQYALPISAGMGTKLVFDARYVQTLTDNVERLLASDPTLHWKIRDVQAGLRLMYPIP
jgi:hypothetical protein